VPLRVFRQLHFRPELQAVVAHGPTKQNLEDYPPTLAKASLRAASHNIARIGRERFRCDADPSTYCWGDSESDRSNPQAQESRNYDRCRQKVTSRMWA
jgi:hypothetical protein